MKKIIILAISALALASCAPGPVGVWNYSVTGTPQGDYTGTLTVQKATAGLTAVMDGQTGKVAFNKFTYTKKDQKTEGDFDFSGVNILFSAKLNKDQLKGTMSTSGMDFPFDATRKK